MSNKVAKPKKKKVRRRTKYPPTPLHEDASLMEWAVWCAKVGRLTGAWKVFPCVQNEKHPLHKGWQEEATCDPKTIKEMWRRDPDANIGLAIEPSFVVIDADLYKPGAEKHLADFEAQHGKFPRTLKHQTPRGGQHLIFRTTKALGNGKGSLPDFGDIRGRGGFIVGPGSSFNGNQYTVENLQLPALLPKRFEDMLVQAKSTVKEGRKVYGEPIGWDEIQAGRLVEFVEQGEMIKAYEGPFVEGERDNRTFQLFATAKGRMIHPDVMLEAVLGSGIAGGLEDDVIERKMESVYHDGNTQEIFGRDVRAYWLPNYLFEVYVDGEPSGCRKRDPVEWKHANPDKLPNTFPGDSKLVRANGSSTTKANAPEFYYLGELKTIPEPTWMIEGILPEQSYSLIYGKRSTKKSFITLDIGLSVATGIPFHGHKVRRGRVVYFAGEGFRGNRRRIEAWFKRRELKFEDFAIDFALVPFTSKWDTTKGRERVRRILEEFSKDGPVALAIIDTARRAMSDDENAPAKVGAFLDGVSEICREYSCGHLVVHHAGKDESRGARGGGPFEDDADAVFHVTKSSGGFVQVKCTKQKDSESDWKMTFHSDVVRLQDNAAGKTISSLALTLESEVTSSDHDVPNHFSKQNRYSEHDEVAVKQLNERKGSPQKRRELAKAVMGELFPESKRADPGTFKKDVRAYDAHLGRIPVIHRLNGYVCERSEKGVPSSFRKPERRNQRKVKPSRKNPKPTETMKRG